jgi:hypothetical protein
MSEGVGECDMKWAVYIQHWTAGMKDLRRGMSDGCFNLVMLGFASVLF